MRARAASRGVGKRDRRAAVGREGAKKSLRTSYIVAYARKRARARSSRD